MPTCPPNLTLSFLTICKIITFKVKEKVFFHCDQGVLEAKKPIFGCRYSLPDVTFLFLVELGTSVQNLTPTREVEHWEKIYFPQGGMLKFTYKGYFLTIKIAYENFLDWKIQMVETFSSASSTRINFYFWKH